MRDRGYAYHRCVRLAARCVNLRDSQVRRFRFHGTSLTGRVRKNLVAVCRSPCYVKELTKFKARTTADHALRSSPASTQFVPQMRSPARSSQGFDQATLPWRTPAFFTGFRVALSIISSIGVGSIHDYTRLRRPVACFASSVRDHPQTSLSRVVTTRSHQVRPQPGRAQQRNIHAATEHQLWFENRSRTEPSKQFQSTPFAGCCQGVSRYSCW